MVQKNKHIKILFCIMWFSLATVSYFLMDLPIAEYVHAKLNPLIVQIGEYVTHLGLGSVWIIGALLWFVVAKFWLQSPVQSKAALLLFLAIIISGLMCNIMKVILGRARPVLWFDQHLYGFYFFKLQESVFRSFPSGHATTIAAAMMSLTQVFPRYGLGFFIVALLVAISRIVVQAHYLSDVMVGLCLGAWVAALLHQYLTPAGR